MSKSLDVINEQRTEKVNRLKIAERERDNLSGSKAEAETFLETEREIRRKRNIQYQIYRSISAVNVEQFKERTEKTQARLAEESAKLVENENRKTEIERESEYQLSMCNCNHSEA